MTAPGTEPVTPMPAAERMPDPTVTPLQHDRVVTARPHQAYNPAPWKQATGQEYLPVARGEWNEV